MDERPAKPYDQAIRDLFRHTPIDFVRVVLGVELGAEANKAERLRLIDEVIERIHPLPYDQRM